MPDLLNDADPMWEQASQLPPLIAFTIEVGGVSETTTGTRQFAVILAALLWSQYEFVADR